MGLEEEIVNIRRHFILSNLTAVNQLVNSQNMNTQRSRLKTDSQVTDWKWQGLSVQWTPWFAYKGVFTCAAWCLFRLFFWLTRPTRSCFVVAVRLLFLLFLRFVVWWSSERCMTDEQNCKNNCKSCNTSNRHPSIMVISNRKISIKFQP